MLKKILVWLGLIFVIASVNAEMINVQYLNAGHGRILAKGKNSDQNRWMGDLYITKTKSANGEIVTIEKRGHGFFGSDTIYKTWNSKGTFSLINNKMIPLEVKDVFYDKSGNIVNSVEKKYDAKSGKIICIVNGKQRVFNLKDDVVDDMNLSFMMTNFPFEKQSINFHLLTLEPDLYSFTGKFLGTEVLNVNGVQKTCYKLKLTPNLGMLGVFAPDSYFWVDAKAPHDFVRYEGLESGLNTPMIVIDSVSNKSNEQ